MSMDAAAAGSASATIRQQYAAPQGETGHGTTDFDLLDTCNQALQDPGVPDRKAILALRAQLLAEAGLQDTSGFK